MLFKQRIIPGLSIHSYVIGDEKSRKAAVIDPVRDIDEYLSLAKGYEISEIIETHVHADFVSGAKELKSALGGKPLILCSGEGGQKWIPRYADRIIHDGDEVVLGEEVRLVAFHTPGHTPEHLSWKVYDKTFDSLLLLTGDFLFAGDVGRPDLLGEESKFQLAHQLYESLFTRLKPLGDEISIFPAHGAGSFCGKSLSAQSHSSLGFERLHNAALQPLPEEEWTQKLMHRMPKAPAYFPRMKRINIEGPKILGTTELTALTPAQMAGKTIVDLRNQEAFARGHLKGSINIPFSPQLASYAGRILDYDQPLALVVNGRFKEAFAALASVGFDDIAGYLGCSVEESGLPLDILETTSVQELSTLESPVIVDVRTEGEWLSGHIPGALHIPLGPLETTLPSKPLYIICGSGLRSSIMASCFKRKGYPKVVNVLGGMTSWKSQALPTTD